MAWISWEKTMGNIWATMPRRGIIHQYGKRIAGWLIDKTGRLIAVYIMSWHDVTVRDALILPVTGKNVSHAGGLRPKGAARLSGVLHYYTRGPD